MNTDIVMILAVFTLGAGLLWGIISWLRAKQARDHHEDAAVAQRQRTEEREGVMEEPDAGRSWSEERGRNPTTPEPPTPMPPRN